MRSHRLLCEEGEAQLLGATETTFALECWRRRAALQRKYRRIRTNEGKVRFPGFLMLSARRVKC